MTEVSFKACWGKGGKRKKWTGFRILNVDSCSRDVVGESQKLLTDAFLSKIRARCFAGRGGGRRSLREVASGHGQWLALLLLWIGKQAARDFSRPFSSTPQPSRIPFQEI